LRWLSSHKPIQSRAFSTPCSIIGISSAGDESLLVIEPDGDCRNHILDCIDADAFR